MFKYLIGATMKNRRVMINCKRKASFKTKDLPYQCYVKFSKYHKLFVDNFSMTKIEARKILHAQQTIFNIPLDHIAEQSQLCQKLNIDMRSLSMNADLLRWSASTLENRVFLFQEMGVKHIHAAMISNFSYMMHMQLGIFKAFTGIPENENVAKNFLNCLDPAPEGVLPLEELNENLSVTEYHQGCLRWYVEWKLQISREDTQLMSRVLFYLRCKSFTLMRRLFDILHHEIGLTLEEIKKHECMAGGTPDNLRKIIDNVKTFGGVDIKKIIKKNPKLHKIRYEDVAELVKQLHKHNFSNRAIRRCEDILFIPKNALISRFEQFQNTPELHVLKNSANALRLIPAFNKVQLRLNYLHYVNIKYVTVRILTAESEVFEKYVRTSLDRSKGKEISKSLEKILRLEARELLLKIRKHPYWRYIDLVSVHETVNFLLERFSPEDLHDSLQLILYPRDKIKETLISLVELNQRSVNEEMDYTPRHILALVLYNIERDFHFTGDGVWRNEPPPTRTSIESLNASEHEVLPDFSDTEGTESDEIDELLIEPSFTGVNENVNTKR